jgi:DNA (cytosine-5)-methyltransferase 1
MANKFYFIDLFAGCGGLSLGLEQAGFEPLLFNEINPSALKTYENHVQGKFNPEFVHDIKDLTDDRIDGLKSKWKSDGIDVDLVAGGPPCWGYSNIGIRRTFKTDKVDIGTNHLYKQMAKVIDRIQPKMFLFENVRGLLNARWTPNGEKSEIWNDVKNTFQGINGYTAEPELVYCYDYGVPQNRPRVIIVGIRDDINSINELNKPCNGRLPDKENKAIPSIKDWLDDLVDPEYLETLHTGTYPTDPQSEIQKEFRELNGEILKKGDPVYNHSYSRHKPEIIKKFQYMIDNDGKIPERMKTKKFAQRVLPSNWKNGKPNITVTSLPDDYVHYSQPRSLTVREWARLQTFPDSFIFHGPRTTGGRRRAGEPGDMFEKREIPQYTQIGNAVPVKMAYKFGKHFKEILN